MSTTKANIIIGIDPDIEKNGVALVNRVTREVELYNMTFCELIDWLEVEVPQNKVHIVVEAGWLNESVWHIKGMGINRAASVGKAVGRNHQTGINIADMAEHMGFDVVRRKPLRKCWKGHDGKITHAEIAYFTGIKQRTNQETRDALLLAWVEANLPIKVKVR